MRPLLLALVLLSGCVTAKPPTHTVPVLAPVAPPTLMKTEFIGVPFSADNLYVCKDFSGSFSCVEYTLFMRALQEQAPSQP